MIKYCKIELFTPYKIYKGNFYRTSLGFVGKSPTGVFGYDYGMFEAHKFAPEEAEAYARACAGNYTVKIYQYVSKGSDVREERPSIERVTVKLN